MQKKSYEHLCQKLKCHIFYYFEYLFGEKGDNLVDCFGIFEYKLVKKTSYSVGENRFRPKSDHIEVFFVELN